MTEDDKKRECPAVNGASQQRDHATEYSDSSRVYRLSPRASRWLDSVVDALAENRISLGQLPVQIVSIYWLGMIHGGCGHDVAAYENQIARLRFQSDYWWFRANNPGRDWYRHAEAELWRVAA